MRARTATPRLHPPRARASRPAGRVRSPAPSDLEKAIAEYQGQKFGEVVAKLTPEKPVTEWPDLKHLRAMAPSVLRHRLRRDPLDESSADIRVERVIAELFQESVDDGGN